LKSKALLTLTTQTRESPRAEEGISLEKVSFYHTIIRLNVYVYLVSKKEERQLLYKEGNMLARVNYIQSESDTPELDIEQGRFSEVHEESKADRQGRDGGARNGSRNAWLKKFKLMTHSCWQIHNSVKATVVDQHRCLLYSTGKDRLIHC